MQFDTCLLIIVILTANHHRPVTGQSSHHQSLSPISTVHVVTRQGRHTVSLAMNTSLVSAVLIALQVTNLYSEDNT